MPRLRNKVTGAVMTVADATARLLGPEWGPVEEAAPTRKRSKAAPAVAADSETTE